MWICLNEAFFSVVAPSPADAAKHPNCLLVRARRPGDLEKCFPDAVVHSDGSRDYLFRAFIPREDVTMMLATVVESIDYGNFKNSVKDDALHHAYNAFWHQHAKLQPSAPYRGPRTGYSPTHPVYQRRDTGRHNSGRGVEGRGWAF